MHQLLGPHHSTTDYDVLIQMCCYSYTTGTFIQPAAGPSRLCTGSSAIFNCTIAMFNHSGIGYAVVDSLWRRNGVIITDTTPGHTLLYTGESSQITGLMVDNATLDDDGTVYTCTREGSPNDFISTAILNVTGGMYFMYSLIMCAVYFTLCMSNSKLHNFVR